MLESLILSISLSSINFFAWKIRDVSHFLEYLNNYTGPEKNEEKEDYENEKSKEKNYFCYRKKNEDFYN